MQLELALIVRRPAGAAKIVAPAIDTATTNAPLERLVHGQADYLVRELKARRLTR